MEHDEPTQKVNKGWEGGQYRPLSDEKIERIHRTALRVLDNIGVAVTSRQAREILSDGGAEVKSGQERVCFSPDLVDKMTSHAPSRINLCGQTEEHDLTLEGLKTYLGTGGATPQVLDLDEDTPRKSSVRDIFEFARLVEELNNIHFFVRPCSAREVSTQDQPVNEFYASLLGTGKHVMGAPYHPRGAAQVMKLGQLIAGSADSLRERPFLSFIVSLVESPLKLDRMGAHCIRRIARHGLPVTLSCAPMAGSTSPLTLAGTLVQLHAEELAGITFSQMVEPGMPVIYGGIPGMAEMHHLRYAGGGVEFGMMNAAISQLAHNIDIPNYNSAGVTEAKIPNVQAVYEKSFAILQCVLSGSNLIHHAAGILESMLTVSYRQLVIDNEITGMATRAVRGIEVDTDRLAYDAIQECVEEGNYVRSDHTIQYLREEFFEPDLADRQNRESWEQWGVPDIQEKATRKARDILSRSPSYGPTITRSLDRQIREQFNIELNPL